MTVNLLKKIAREIRKEIVKMHRIGPNVGSAMSVADILAVLYFDIMNIDSPEDPGRDRFILSKGHAVSALYAALALKGFIPQRLLDTYLKDASPLSGHPVAGSVPGIEVSTGSLGHGLPIAAGMALAAKKDGRKYRVFALMGDGECQEGSVWEGAAIASRLKLDNLIVIVDANNLQGYERVENILPVSSIERIWQAFGWKTVSVDGHCALSLRKTLSNLPVEAGIPSAVIAHTVKGKGIAEMEDKLEWHYYSVPGEKLPVFQNELEERE
ncbi:MAG: transketolase [Deltaproteobacteria bacterium]|nr:transketolase [Deltaproteobacteria bacterium]